ncbi:MAG: ABC transporter permease [Tissierellia bacterium]|nr:ABC transporter permease [Tissierellia bacterium]
MKLFSSFVKELKIASRGFYFYIEIFMALLILVLFLFVIPDNFDSKKSEYIYLDMPAEGSEIYLKAILDESIEGKAEEVKVKINKEEKKASLYTTDNSRIYILTSREDTIYMADKERKIAAIIGMDENYNFHYEYYLQGYESARYKDLLKILHVHSSDVIEEAMDNIEVRPLLINYDSLSDRENMLPSILVFNGSLMGLFIIAAYIFLDRQEGVIKAFALTPTPVWQYLMSKIGVLMLTSIVSSFIVLLPLMKLRPDYLLLLVLLITTAFFSSSLGLLIASFYKDIIQAFGTIYIFMMIMILPNIAYFMPSWNPIWIKIIPTYPMLEGFKSVILGSGDTSYVLSISAGFLFAGMILFALANHRYKKTLVV